MNSALALPASASVCVDLHRFDLDVAASRADTLAECLSEAEKTRAARFASERDRQYWSACRGLLRTTLAAYLGRAAQALNFDAGANGKPHVAAQEGEESLHFNLSHSGDVALLAISHAGPLGVDVEATKPIRDWAAVARRCFSPAERNQLRAVPASDRRHAFYRCWTRKEAVIKATGEGLSADLHAFDVTLAADEPARMLAYRGDVARDWALVHFEPRRGYVGALAVPNAQDGDVLVTHRHRKKRTH